jgi:predicted dehydrogenase
MQAAPNQTKIPEALASVHTEPGREARPAARKRYVAVGTGGRIPMFIDPIARDYKDSARILAFCDPSTIRMDYHIERLAREYGTRGIRTYAPEDFERMLDEQKPDAVIICTVDALHSDYILRSLAKGCDVICEKPITTDAEKCRAILAAASAARRHVRVTFNMRWVPGLGQLRKLVADGAVGTVKHVSLEYLLNTSHGADYFRRWHSEKASSGGLLVHKSTHHFDFVNWVIDSIPETVYAMGDLVFYGKENAVGRWDGALTGYSRSAGSPNPADPFHLDLAADETLKGLYLDAENETGYIRDRNVFRDGIDIEDSMSVLVKYRSGVMLNYSLNAYCPYEGFRLHISGDRGRVEYEERHASHIIRGQSDAELEAEQASGDHWRRLVHFPLFGLPVTIPIEEGKGSHGGGDPLLQEQIFSANPPPDALHCGAGHEQGIASAIIGIAANQSLATGLPVKVSDLVSLRPGETLLSRLI